MDLGNRYLSSFAIDKMLAWTKAPIRTLDSVMHAGTKRYLSFLSVFGDRPKAMSQMTSKVKCSHTTAMSKALEDGAALSSDESFVVALALSSRFEHSTSMCSSILASYRRIWASERAMLSIFRRLACSFLLRRVRVLGAPWTSAP